MFIVYLFVCFLFVALYVQLVYRTKVLCKLFQMQSLNPWIELNTRKTRSCRLGIALTSCAKLNIVKLAPAHAGGCDGLTLSHENALSTWNRELRALPRSLCEHQRSKMIRRSPDKKKRGQRRMTGAAHTVECHQKLRANVPNERRKNKKRDPYNSAYCPGSGPDCP